MGRGKSRRSLELVDAAYDILQTIQPASVRAVCYQLFNRKLISSMAKAETNRVSTQLRDARERGVIPWHWIVDETREAECIDAWEDPAAYIETVKRAYRRDRWTDQPDRVEVWSEKGTIRGTLAPVLQTYGVTFRVMHGYGSATAVHDVAEQSAASDKPWTVLYVGDWDPSGLHMSEIDLRQRLERYGGAVDITRVALTINHCLDLGAAPSFALETKRHDPRYQWFRRLHGARCWELDALSPVVLRDAVEAAIVDRLDLAAWQRAEQAERAERESLVSILDTWPGISRQAPKYDPGTSQP
jgi:hypothetical protein